MARPVWNPATHRTIHVMKPTFRQVLASSAFSLVGIKLLHTAVWAVMAGCIMGLPVAAFTRHFGWAFAFTALAVGECAVLALNGGRCPMTDWASRFTDNRSPNFDIYLPVWVAQHNKVIFGTLGAANIVIVLWRWLSHP